MAKRRIIPLFIPHAGCPHQCVFCDQVRITGTATPVTPERAAWLIQEALPAAGEGCELAFYGGSFTALPVEVQRGLLEEVRPYRERGSIASIRLSTRPDAVDKTICALLREYGVTTVELGCQSMDPKVLEMSQRGHSPADTERAYAQLRRYGFQVILQMMTGLPGDDGQASRETAKKLAALHPDGVRIYPTAVLRGTELARMMEAGIYRPQTVEEAVPLCADLYERFLEAGIPVIRLGLHPTDELDRTVMAGAYHPALGELVLSELFLRRARTRLAEAAPLDRAVLLVHPRRVSVMTGQKGRNLQTLQAEFHLSELRIRSAVMGLWDLEIERMV